MADHVRGGLAEVEHELAELWRGSSEGGVAVVRACTLNLVVACTGERDADDATRLIARIAETEPGRSIVIVPRPDRPRGLDTWVSAHCHRGAGGATVCSEQITLEVGQGAAELVPASVLQLLVEEMPVYVWWRRPSLDGEPLLEPLRDLSSLLIVHAGALAAPRLALERLDRVSRHGEWRGRVSDLTWVRLEPWREAVASFFDAPAHRELARRIDVVGIAAGGPVDDAHFTAAGAYLAGWLASRLGWHPGDGGGWRRPDGGGVRLELRHDGQLAAGEVAEIRLVVGEGRRGEQRSEATLLASRAGCGGDCVRLRSTIAGRDARAPQLLKLPPADEPELLCGLLQAIGPDPVYRAALAEAARLARR